MEAYNKHLWHCLAQGKHLETLFMQQVKKPKQLADLPHTTPACLARQRLAHDFLWEFK